ASYLREHEIGIMKPEPARSLAEQGAIVARCEKTNVDAIGNRTCIFKAEYKQLNSLPIKACRAKCLPEDKVCKDRCFYSQLNIPASKMDAKFKLVHYIKKCQHTTNIDACLSAYLKVDPEAIHAANECSNSKCISEETYRGIFLCTLECQKNLTEPLNATSFDELSKDTETLGPEFFTSLSHPYHHPTSLLKYSLAILLLLSFAY
ncbi:hypothetical protein L0F63_001805, partial [Massospora cicadina]